MENSKKVGNQEMRLNDEDLRIIKSTFADNDKLLKLLRKVFLPEITFNAPLGQNIDLWMTIKVDEMLPEQALINLKARNSLIQHIEGQLVVLKALAGQKDETVGQMKQRLKKDSAK